MKKLSAQDLEACRFQGSLFEASAELCDCSSPIFVRRFMNSELARRFDEHPALAESSTKQSLVDELDEEYGSSTYGTVRYGPEILYWMGYLYRYWNIAYGTPSKQIYKVVQARELSELYYPYHSLDPTQAIERICEAKSLEPEEAHPSDGYIEEGVKLLRQMHQSPTYRYWWLSGD